MKKLLLLLAVALLPFLASAQTVIDTTANNATEEYCSLAPKGKLFSRKIQVDVDFGQEAAYGDDQRLTDRFGKPLVFNSVINALNYMARQGWLLINTVTTEDGTRYLMRRKLVERVGR